MKSRIIKYLKSHQGKIGKFISDKKHFFFILIISWCCADLIIISLQPLLLSDAMPLSPIFNKQKKLSSNLEYMPIWDFKVFHNADIPPPLSSQPGIQNKHPVKSNLPIKLNGTIIFRNPIYSIASITVKNTSQSYRIQEEIDDSPNDNINPLARITDITADRVYFINLKNNMLEYIEKVPTEFEFFQPVSSDNSTTKRQKNNFLFQVNRHELNKYIQNLPTILQDAKVVKHFENGEMIGFRFDYIKPGSEYEKKLNFQKGDIILSVNGESPKTIQEGIKLFHELRNNSKFDVVIRRGGKKLDFSWIVNDDDFIEPPPASRFY